MAASKNPRSRSGAGPKGRRVKNPIEQRSPRNHATGGYDPDDYHGDGPIPVGNAPVRSEEDTSLPAASPQAPGIQGGIVLNRDPKGNPGDVPNTEPRRSDLDREALGDSVKPDETLKKAS